MTINFNQKEVNSLIIGVIILGFIFGFDDGQEIFIASHWLANFFRFLLIAAISLLIHVIAHKITANKFGATIEYENWSIRRYWFSKKANFPLEVLGVKLLPIKKLPIGIVLALLFAFTSLGKIIFATIESIKIKSDRIKRIGKQFPELTDFETAIIGVSGPLISLFLALLFKSFNTPILEPFIKVNYVIALYTMIPFPGLDGAKILFGSKGVYVLSLVFIIMSIALIMVTGIAMAIFLSIITALILFLIYLYKESG